VGLIAGGHLYLTWVQFWIVHSWCVLCIATALVGFTILVATVMQKLSRKCVVGGLAGAIASVATLLIAHSLCAGRADSRNDSRHLQTGTY